MVFLCAWETRFCCELNTKKKTQYAPTLTRKRKMILTNCAACAAPLAHTAPRCVRCQTRYCNKTCQHDHRPQWTLRANCEKREPRSATAKRRRLRGMCNGSNLACLSTGDSSGSIRLHVRDRENPFAIFFMIRGCDRLCVWQASGCSTRTPARSAAPGDSCQRANRYCLWEGAAPKCCCAHAKD